MLGLNKNYIIGLVDGEGSFTVYVQDPNSKEKRKRRVVVEPKFYVKLIEKDKTILYSLQKFFGCGNIYEQKDKRANHQNCYRYEVGKRDDLINIIIPFFKTNQLKFPSKSKDFQIFCKIMKMIQKNEHLEEDGLKKIFKSKQGMH